MIIGIWPILMGASMWVQQKLNPAPTDPIQAKIAIFHSEVEAVFERISEEYEVVNVLSHLETGIEITFRRDKKMKKS